MAEAQDHLKFSTDNDVEDLRKQLGKLNHGDASSSSSRIQEYRGKFTNYNPGAHIVVFEGGKGKNDQLHFPRYDGEKHGYHKRRRTYRAALVQRRSQVSDGKYENDEFVKQFTSQIQLVNIIYEKESHGRLRVLGRFGKLYYFDDPPEKKMTVETLLTYDKKTYEKGKRMFRSTFVPREFPHVSVEAYLLGEGYQMVSVEERIMIQIQPLGPHGKIQCTILQNGDCEFLEFRYPDFKWCMFNVVRKDVQRRDVRLAVESIRETYEEKDPVVLQYRGAKILTRNSSGLLEINEQYQEQVNFVREKTTRKYKKKTEMPGEFSTEVHLLKSREYSVRNAVTGQFDDIKDWREEVVIQPEVPDINNADAVKEFASSFIGFCYNFESLF